MKISNLLTNIAKTKPAQKFYKWCCEPKSEKFLNNNLPQKFYKWCCEPKSEKFLNNNLPQIETVLSTGCYIWSTAKQKNLEKDEKQLLQVQNVGSGLVGLGIGSWANKKVGKWGDAIIKDLDPTKLDPKSIRKITTGIRIGLPILSTAVCMRWLIPCALAGFSGKWMDKVREKRKLDTKV